MHPSASSSAAPSRSLTFSAFQVTAIGAACLVLACSGQTIPASASDSAGDPTTTDPTGADPNSADPNSAADEFVSLAQGLVAPEPPAPASGAIYVTLRRDVRRCAAPLCGGFFIQRVNRLTTQCADGERRAECYVAELDFAALGLSEEQATFVQSSAESFLLRGNVGVLSSDFGELGRLDVTEAWQGHPGVEPRGAFLRVKDTGLRCITTPCLSLSAALLELPLPALPVAELDLEGISEDTSDGVAQLGALDGLLVAARPSVVRGPGGTALGVDASEYYVPLVAKPGEQPQVCGSRGLPECPEGTFCAFPPEADCGRADAPGTCARRPEACTQIFDPVCGCDGQTHGNACSASSAGVSIEFDGACEGVSE